MRRIDAPVLPACESWRSHSIPTTEIGAVCSKINGATPGKSQRIRIIAMLSQLWTRREFLFLHARPLRVRYRSVTERFYESICNYVRHHFWFARHCAFAANHIRECAFGYESGFYHTYARLRRVVCLGRVRAPTFEPMSQIRCGQRRGIALAAAKG